MMQSMRLVFSWDGFSPPAAAASKHVAFSNVLTDGPQYDRVDSNPTSLPNELEVVFSGSFVDAPRHPLQPRKAVEHFSVPTRTSRRFSTTEPTCDNVFEPMIRDDSIQRRSPVTNRVPHGVRD